MGPAPRRRRPIASLRGPTWRLAASLGGALLLAPVAWRRGAGALAGGARWRARASVDSSSWRRQRSAVRATSPSDDESDDWLRGVRDVFGSKEADLEARLRSREKVLEDLQAELEKERAARGEAQEKGTKAERKADDLEEQLVGERAALKVQKARTVEAQQTVEELGAQVARLQFELDEAEKGVEVLQGQVKQLRDELNSEMGMGEDLRQQISSLQESYSDLSDRLEMSEGCQIQTSLERQRLHDDLEMANVSINKMGCIMEDRTKELEAAQRKLKSVRGSLKSALDAFARKFVAKNGP